MPCPNHPAYISGYASLLTPHLSLLDEAILVPVPQQLYPFWELCIADDASTHAGSQTAV